MAAPPPERPDPNALARWQARAARQPQAPWLHAEIARRMAERLAAIRRTPATVLDWWAHLGASASVLAATYPDARRVAVEPSDALLQRSLQAAQAPWWSPRRWLDRAPLACREDEVPAGEAQLLWANMMLHAVADPDALFARWRRALAVDGFLMFSTLGPDTLRELRALYAGQGWAPPGQTLADMHDIGDALVRAGFADPVMDQERLVLTWTSPQALLEELRGLGVNAHAKRHAGLRTPRWHARLLQALQGLAGPDGRIALTFEVVYGHAFNPPPRAKVTERTEVSLDAMRQMVRAGRPHPSGE